MPPALRLCTLFLAWFSWFYLVQASSGDRSPEFQTCAAQCVNIACSSSNNDTPPLVLPLSLRLTFWSCSDDCEYRCMHAITDRAVLHPDQEEIQQYYGKWPFWRFLGMQEPASVLFSLMNMWMHVGGLRLLQRKLSRDHPMKGYYVWWARVSVNAWVWSAIFHTRDKPITERFDYFGAALAILFALYFTVIRMFRLYSISERERLVLTSSSALSSSSQQTQRLLHTIWTIICILTYIAHVMYLSLLPRFDYTYNMAFNLTIGLLHNILWLLYSLPLPSYLLPFRRFPSPTVKRAYRPPYAWKAGVFVGFTMAATALELFDFPPLWRVLDAHALWHAATVGIVPLWYRFLVQDAEDPAWRIRRN